MRLLPNRAPGICTGLRFVYGLPVGDEGILDLPNTGVAPAGDISYSWTRNLKQVDLLVFGQSKYSFASE